MRFIALLIITMASCVSPALAAAGETASAFVHHWAGYAALVVFVAAYIMVMVEEKIHLRKSKPVMLAAGIIWVLVALAYSAAGIMDKAVGMLRHNVLEYAELLLFLLAAMTFINAMAERHVFESLRTRIAKRNMSLRAVFWMTGVLAFFLSPIADNLTTALIMGAVVIAIGGSNKGFIAIACVNITVAANAGGAFSPFGDITTLMVWQKGMVAFEEFFALFFPSLINWLVPAAIMSVTIPGRRARGGVAAAAATSVAKIKHGGVMIICLFILTIATTVYMHHVFHLPPFLGMMTGLGALMSYGYFIRRNDIASWSITAPLNFGDAHLYKPAQKPFDIFISMKRAEWDTLMFFYGIILCIGGLSAFGYLAVLSHAAYDGLGPTIANTLVGILSAIVDNIPLMFAVLNMNLQMDHGQWLLVTLTAGVGGSLLSIGSAAGLALMGQARGVYTFLSHLKWTWAIGLGYAASIWLHLWLNAASFTQ